MVEIENADAFKQLLVAGVIESKAMQGIDLTPFKEEILSSRFTNCIFMGCEMDHEILYHIHIDNHIFPRIDVPYGTYPNGLYSRETLYNGYDRKNPESYNETQDKIVYEHYLKTGKEAKNIKETLARRLHDHSITDALHDFLNGYDEKKIVAIMGGHGLSRSSTDYFKAVLIAKALAEKGYLMISGGGPGAMEATHVGAWFAGKSIEELENALEILRGADRYDHPNWLSTAFEVIEKFPPEDGHTLSLGIPTWLYGHEPPTPFATHIAKYFANSVREEGLLAIAKGGVIFTPGSAGTIQEIFQDLTQNHYKTYQYASPMVFMNQRYWSYDRPIYPMLELMKLRGNLNNLFIGLYDNIEDIISHIEDFEFEE